MLFLILLNKSIFVSFYKLGITYDISYELFKFETSSNYKLVITHIIFGRLAIIVMFLYIGMHLDRIFSKIKNKRIKIFLYMIYVIVAIISSVYSIYTLTHSFEWVMAFGM